MSQKDVTIIGGSAAGLFTACLLAQAGLHVRLFEASERINPPPRTLIVTEKMQQILGPMGYGAVINKVHRFELFADGQVAHISLGHPDLVVERSRLIRALAADAEEAGVQILTGNRFLGMRPNGKGLTLSVSRDGDTREESARTLVGADGAFSAVARSGGWPQKDTVPLIQALVELPKDQPPDTTRVWFIPEETPYFYWLIPHSENKGVVGLICEGEEKGKRFLEGFLEKKALNPLGFQYARTPVYHRWISNHRSLGDGHLYLVGDAAGHVKVSTVGGMVTGFSGALGVSEAILHGNPSRKLLSLRKELECHKILRMVLNTFSQKDYLRLFDLLTVPTRRSLETLHRDETGRLLRRLLIKQPRFLLLGLRSLIMGK